MSDAADDPLPFTIGERPNTVRVFRRSGRKNIYLRIWDPERESWRKRSLGHDDPKRARVEAAELHAKLVAGRDALRGERKVELRHLFALYEKHRTPQKGTRTRRADRRRIELFTRLLGPEKPAEEISREEWDRFIELRSSGAVDARGNPVPETAPCSACDGGGCADCGGSGEVEPRRPVGPNTVRKDLQFLVAALNWGTEWRTDGGFLLSENSCRGYPLPQEKNPSQPMATDERVAAVRSVAPAVEMEVRWNGERRIVRSHLAGIFDLAVETGRRLTSILRLRHADVLREEGPHGSIRWRAEADKEGRESVVPLSAPARRALDRHARRMRRLDLSGIGRAPVFPAPGDPSEPVSRHLADKWLREAEEEAEGVEPLDGSLWHAYRRRWATSRKGLPAPDVAEAGGWAGPETLQKVYQKADADTMYEVVSGGGEVREAR